MKLKISGLVCGLLSYASLLLPIYTTKMDGEGGSDLIIRGFNLAEFSVWGNLLMAIPIVLFAITYCKVKNKWKNIMFIGTYIFGVITLYYASVAADTWIRDIATGFVICRPYQLIYFLALLVSMGFLFVHFNDDPDSEE